MEAPAYVPGLLLRRVLLWIAHVQSSDGADSDELMEISEAELEAAIADATGMPEPERETLLNLIEKGLAVDNGMRRNVQWQCISPRPW
jgi:hypothetical protein